MRQSGLLTIAALGLMLGNAGCRSCCGDRPGLFSRFRSQDSCAIPVIDREAGRGCGSGIFPVGRRKPSGIDGLPPDAVLLSSSSPTLVGLPIAPSYPSGVPTPVSPNNGSPPNELPPPSISPPGVPESPFAQPIPAAQTGSTLPLPASAQKSTNAAPASQR